MLVDTRAGVPVCMTFMVSLFSVLPENAVLAYVPVKDTGDCTTSSPGSRPGSQFITVGLKVKMLRKRQALRPNQSVS